MNGNSTTTRFQNGSLILVTNKTIPDTWFFRLYDTAYGKRVHRKQRIGTVREYPRRRDAENAVLSLRAKINAEARSPETVNRLVTHYLKRELTPARKAFAMVEVHSTFLRLYIIPKWGSFRLSQVRTVAVEA